MKGEVRGMIPDADAGRESQSTEGAFGGYRRPSFPVFDFHAHFPVEEDFAKKDEYIRRFGREKWEKIAREADRLQEDWRQAWSFLRPDTEREPLEALMARWAAEVDRYGLDGIAFVTGGGNDLLARILGSEPRRFVGFAHHSPEKPDAAEELRRAVTELGLRGYKILAPLLEGSLADERLYPVWQAAEDLEVPILIHFGILGGGGGIGNAPNIDPLVIHDVAKAFPDVTFVIPHFGCGYTRELLQLAWACPNVSVDTSGNNEWVHWFPYELDLKKLFWLFYETVGPRRIIFGSDSSWFPRGFAHRYLLDQIRACRELRIGEDDMALIFGGNAKRLLKLDDRAVPGERG
ncbi:MAG: amidohydrolase family protein [Bacillota bacterium]|nr:amidohydrolase family protein [Bacillota bacterium]